MNDQLMKVKEIASALKCSVRQVFNFLSAGELVRVKISPRITCSTMESVQALIDRRKAE